MSLPVDLQDPYNYRLTVNGERFIFNLLQMAIYKQYITTDDRINYRLEERSKKLFKSEFETFYWSQKRIVVSVLEILDLINKIVSELINTYEIEIKSKNGYILLTIDDINTDDKISNNIDSKSVIKSNKVTEKPPFSFLSLFLWFPRLLERLDERLH